MNVTKDHCKCSENECFRGIFISRDLIEKVGVVGRNLT